MNLQLTNASVLHTGAFDSCGGEVFVRGNTVRYIHLDKNQVDVEPLMQACRRNY